MAVRHAMQPIIDRLRRMLGGDETEGNWSDDRLQDALDDHCELHRFCHTQPLKYRGPGGVVAYQEFQSAGTAVDWEEATLYDSTYNVVDSSLYTADLRRGMWTFTVPRSNAILYISGTTHCLPAAAVDLLTEHLGALRRRTDIRDKDTENKRSQATRATQDLIDRYEAMVPVRAVKVSRSDV